MVLAMSFELSNLTITTLCIFLFCYLHLDVDCSTVFTHILPLREIKKPSILWQQRNYYTLCFLTNRLVLFRNELRN